MTRRAILCLCVAFAVIPVASGMRPAELMKMLARDAFFGLTDNAPQAMEGRIVACTRRLSGHPGTTSFAAMSSSANPLEAESAAQKKLLVIESPVTLSTDAKILPGQTLRVEPGGMIESGESACWAASSRRGPIDVDL